MLHLLHSVSPFPSSHSSAFSCSSTSASFTSLFFFSSIFCFFSFFVSSFFSLSPPSSSSFLFLHVFLLDRHTCVLLLPPCSSPPPSSSVSSVSLLPSFHYRPTFLFFFPCLPSSLCFFSQTSPSCCWCYIIMYLFTGLRLKSAD